MGILTFLLLILIHQDTILCSFTFVQEPATQYVFANQMSSSFQCICNGCEGQFWKINGTNANQYSDVGTKGPMVLDNDFYKYVLTIPTTDLFNNSNITCHIHKNALAKMSKTAKLQIQSFASAVTNILIMQLNSSSLRLEFCPSFALDESVAVDYYIIDVIGERGDTKHINTSSTAVTVSLAEYCSNYTVTITPYNAVGQGEKNTKTGIIVFQEPVIAGNIVIGTMVLKGSYGMWITFKADLSCLGSVPRQMDASIVCTSKMCSSTYLQSCLLNIISRSSEPSGNCSIDFNSTPLNEHVTEVRVNLTEYIAQGSYYEIYVTLKTTSSSLVPSLTSTFNLSTFHTTAAEITSFSLLSVCIKCSLHHDSITTGCLAIFEDLTDENNVIMQVVNRIPDEVIAYNCFESLQDGHYKVSVTDVEFQGEETLQHIAFVLMNELTIQRLQPMKTLNHFSSGIRSINFNVDESQVDLDGRTSSSLLTRALTSSVHNTSSKGNISVMELLPSSSVVLTNALQESDDKISFLLSAVLSPIAAGIALIGIICLFIIILKILYHRKAQSTTGLRDVTISYVNNSPQWSRDYQNSGAEVAVRKCVAYESCSKNPIYATITDH